MDALALISQTPLDEASDVPLYRQLKHRILQLVATEALAPGEMLPTEQQLSEVFGLSRATVRRCFKDLVDEGYVTRRRGRGTFVAAPGEQGGLETLYAQVSTSSFIERSGARASSRFLGLRLVEATGAAARALALGAGARAWELNRLRLADGEPVVHELAYVPEALCPKLGELDLEGQSLYRRIAEESGALAARTEERVEAIVLDKRETKLLQAPVGSAGLRIIARSLDVAGSPIEASVGIARADRLHLDVTYGLDGMYVRKAL